MSVYTPRVTAIRKARKLKYLSPGQAAKAAGCSPETWRRVELGEQRPKRPGAIARVLGLTVDQVLEVSRGAMA